MWLHCYRMISFSSSRFRDSNFINGGDFITLADTKQGQPELYLCSLGSRCWWSTSHVFRINLFNLNHLEVDYLSSYSQFEWNQLENDYLFLDLQINYRVNIEWNTEKYSFYWMNYLKMNTEVFFHLK